MEIISSLDDFYKFISLNDIIENKTFNFDSEELIVRSFKSIWVSFIDCEFNCNNLTFRNIENVNLSLEFENCSFNCDVNVDNCKMERLQFLRINKIKSLNIYSGFSEEKKTEIKYFKFNNSFDEKKEETILSTSFSFDNVLFKKYFEFNKINNINGIFNFSNNVIGDELHINNSSCVFHTSKLSNINFINNEFNTFTSFKDSIFSFNKKNFKNTGNHWNESKFWNNKFQKLDFTEVEFINKITFDKCDFLSTTWFEKCKNIINSNVNFIACEFKGFVLFNRSALKLLNIDRCTFDKSVSFTEAFFIKIKLFEVKFNGGAYFDEMIIGNVENKAYLKDREILDWKRTLRAIKQELQKTENKIDFNRFRAYELAAHYEELGWGWKSGFKDKFILWATKWSTDFGNSWRRSLAFTLLSGLFWFSIFFYIDFYLTGNYQYNFNTNYGGIFGNGYFRFLLVTDFYNPLVEDRTYIQNFWSWIPFIFGKIFVAFGIYEMIQSFRKFKA